MLTIVLYTSQYLKENLDALKIVIAGEDVAELRRLAEAADGHLGVRYHQPWINVILVDTPPLKA